jgi:hypothetical protein
VKKANKHPRPETYRIILRCGSWVTKTERYYTVHHSSEALEDIYHTFHAGKIHSNKITILDIQEYIKYSNTWVSRMDVALDNIENIDVNTLLIKPGKITIVRG